MPKMQLIPRTTSILPEKSVYSCKVKITAPSATVHPAYTVKLPNIADV